MLNIPKIIAEHGKLVQATKYNPRVTCIIDAKSLINDYFFAYYEYLGQIFEVKFEIINSEYVSETAISRDENGHMQEIDVYYKNYFHPMSYQIINF